VRISSIQSASKNKQQNQQQKQINHPATSPSWKKHPKKKHCYLVVSTPLKNMIVKLDRVKIKNVLVATT